MMFLLILVVSGAALLTVVALFTPGWRVYSQSNANAGQLDPAQYNPYRPIYSSTIYDGLGSGSCSGGPYGGGTLTGAVGAASPPQTQVIAGQMQQPGAAQARRARM